MKEGVLMSLRQKYVNILSGIVPAGAVGVSLLLGSAEPSVANEHPTAAQPLALDRDRVAERLAAIREAVSAMTVPEGAAKPADRNLRLAWGNWWNNWGWGGWGRPWGWPNWNNWRNWNNWHNSWRNW
jgi:outer membrane murein-binding lipoprotein Lpp